MSKFKMTQIKGVIPAMMTFFDKEENVDIQCTRRMVDFMLDHGADGFYLTGSTGECFTMTAEERNLVVDTVIDQVKGRVPVIVHVGDIGTKKSIELAKHAYEAGADAISSVPPFYWKFRADDIYSYYKDISEATPLPMVVYNIQLAGLMDMGLLLKLADLPNVHGLKYTARSHDEMGYLKEKLGMAIIFITHDLGVISEMADEVVVMYAGEIVEKAETRQLFDNPMHPYTEGLMASIPDIDQEVDRLQTLEGLVPSLYDMPSGCRKVRSKECHAGKQTRRRI